MYKQQEFIYLRSKDWGVKDQGAGSLIKSKICVWSGPTFWFIDGDFLLSPHTVEGARELCGVSSIVQGHSCLS